YKYSLTNNYGTATDNGTNTSFTQTGLTCNTSYTLFVWAYNASGCNSSATTLTQLTSSCCVNVTITSATAAATPICANAITVLTANGVSGTNAIVNWWTQTNGGGTNVGGPYSGTGSVPGPTLGPGNYYARVTGTCGAAVEALVAVGSNPNPAFSVTPVNVSCNGANDGQISINVTVGTAPYTYSLTGGSPFPYSVSPVTGLSPNTYNVMVQDNNGCVSLSSTPVIITEPNTLFATASNTGSYGVGQNVQLNSTISGGTTPYTYSWSGPGGYTATGANPTRNNATVVMSGPYTVNVIDANGCTATSITNVVVNPTTTYTWTGATNTAWNVITNWSPVAPVGGPNACSDDVVIPFVVNQPVLASAASVGNIQLNANALLTLNADLSVCKNVTGGTGGLFSSTTGSGSMILSGNTPQTINGYIEVNELRLNNSAGASIIGGASVKIFTSLDLQSGNFNATSGGLTFLSTSVNQVAIIDNFSPGYSGTMSGNIYAQRFYGGGTSINSYNQHFMGSPVSSPAFSQFGASGTPGYIIPTANCDESHVAPNSPYSNVLTLDETHGATCTSAQWIAETSNSGNAVNGVGYAIARVGAGIVTLNGAPNLNPSYTIANRTNSNWSNVTLQGHTVVSGWSFVSNPYLATLNINTTNAGFDNQIDVWNSNGPFAGTYQPGIVGLDAVVAPFQGFMVHKTNPGGTANYTIKATDRVRTAHTFFHANDNELKIVAENTSTNLLDQTVIAFNTAATDQFDPEYDANKWPGSLNRHTLYSLNNNKWMARNILHDINQTSTVPVGFQPGATATYSFSFNGTNTFDATSYIYLEDKTLHVMHDVRNGDYRFTADSADAWERFVLHFTPPAVMSVTDANCNAPGTISVTQPGIASWNYTITDNANHTIASGTLNQTSPLNLTAPAGAYTLTLTDINNYTVTQMLQVNGTDPVTASFTANSNAVQEAQNVVLTSTTANATNYQWNLGNGQTANGQTVTYNYSTPGTYPVVLTVSNLSGCTSSTSQTITVNAIATGLTNITDKGIGIWSNEDKVFVDFRSLQKVDAVISIYNVLGQQLTDEKFNTNALYQKEIKNIEAAYLIVSVKNDDKVITRKVFINNIR
ncbi:MAG: hypothetical protein JWO06_945, partial [Bacteroidota bacterium]|nr:hypothetical protein [Bacteroidota bacterium]